MIDTQKELIAASQAIGNISNAAPWYTNGLAERIEESNQYVHQLAVSELITIAHEYHEYHRTARGMTLVEGIDWAAAGYPFEGLPNRDGWIMHGATA